MDRVDQRRDSLAGDGRDRQDLAAQLAGDPVAGLGLAPVRSILVTTSELGPLGQGGAVLLELVADRPVVGDRVRAVDRDGLDQVDEQAGPLDVPEELVAQAVARVGPLDQPGDVGDDERVLASRRRPCRGWDTWS